MRGCSGPKRWYAHAPHTPALHEQLTPLFSKVGYIVVYTIEEMAPTNGQPVYQFTIVSVVSIPSVPRLEFVNEVSAAFSKATLAHPLAPL